MKMTNTSWTGAFALLTLGVAAACGTQSSDVLSGGGYDPAATAIPTGDAGAATGVGDDDATDPQVPPGSAGTGAATGLPCDVQHVLENRCISCHGGTTSPRLLGYDDMLKPSTDPAKTLAVKSLERMKDTALPMPPKPAEAPTPAEIAAFDAWVKAGTPKGAACTGTPPLGSVDAGPSPYATPTMCTSMQTWKGGDDGSSRMRPGGNCISCHSKEGGPGYTAAGTVYPSAHEPDDCNGVNGQVKVVLTDKNGVVTELNVNSVGNFNTKAQLAAPFRVKVVNGAKERVMVGPVTAGDCNSCHTLAGINGAPGRIVAP